MTATMPVEERERLARRYAAQVAPRLRAAVDRRDADRIADLTLGLDRQELLALVVVLASQWPTTSYWQMVDCRHCGEYDRHDGHGLCVRCHRLWDAAGRPDSGPPAPTPPQVSGRRGALHRIEAKAERLQEYVHLGGDRLLDEVAAARLGVSAKTIAKDRRELARHPLQLRIPANREYQEAS